MNVNSNSSGDFDNTTRFTPLNISYTIPKYSNRMLLGTVLSIIVIGVGVIGVSKINSEMSFNVIFGSKAFKIIGIIAVIYLASFIFRKISLNENAKLKEYIEMIDHELTTVEDLWDISAIDGNLISYTSGSYKVYIRCQKGYVVSREPSHREEHYRRLSRFLRVLLNQGFYIEYYSYRDGDSNLEPLFEIEKNLKNSKNDALTAYGNATIKFCRRLQNQCNKSEIEYFGVECRDLNYSSKLIDIVTAAITDYLSGSLYTDIRLCDVSDITEMITKIHKVRGVNVRDMMLGQSLKTQQQVVKILDVYYNKNDINKEEKISSEAELTDDAKRFIDEINQIMSETSKKNRNLSNKNTGKLLGKRNADDADNVIGEEDMPILVEEDDDDEDLAISGIDDEDDEDLAISGTDDEEDLVISDTDDEDEDLAISGVDDDDNDETISNVTEEKSFIEDEDDFDLDKWLND